MIRLYLDCFEGDRAIWQVDSGAGSKSWKVTEVQVRGAHGVTRQNLNADNLSEPKCWLEYDGEVTIHQGIALIRRKHGQEVDSIGSKAPRRIDSSSAPSRCL